MTNKMDSTWAPTYKSAWIASDHKWVTKADGTVDIFAYEYKEYHNGPKCAVCGYGECWHCVEEPTPCPAAGDGNREGEREMDYEEEDGLDTARGILYGCLIGAALWIVGALAGLAIAYKR